MPGIIGAVSGGITVNGSSFPGAAVRNVRFPCVAGMRPKASQLSSENFIGQSSGYFNVSSGAGVA
ncbi:hypothetical protein [Caballeronia sp. LZ035]|uniref:hypothetical protein n=1 Tax=Caballeronia sp. LZ035 TaxID=3038568 RepID=UPI00286447E4|nr:hypothetical protein [Caballeronia sp. LZ035]MDR5761443.1 hypothetical protein [Caballeronia sp. LZ035]